MADLIACGQADILGAFSCIECEGPLLGAGIAARIGRACSEDCAADQSARLDWQERQDHIRLRDLHCACDVCVDAGMSGGDTP